MADSTREVTCHQRLWDKANLRLNQLDTVVDWTYAGQNVVSYSAHNATANHREGTLGVDTGGWSLENQSVVITDGDRGQDHVSFRGTAQFSYGGMFDVAGLKHVTYDNLITVNGAGTASYSTRHDPENPHFQGLPENSGPEGLHYQPNTGEPDWCGDGGADI